MASGINLTPDGVPELTKGLETLDKLVSSIGKLAGTGKALEELRKIIVGVGDSGSALGQLQRSVQDLAGIVRGLPVEIRTALDGLKTVGTNAGKALGEGVEQGAKASLSRAKSAVRQEINQMQLDYEAAVAKGWKIKPEVLGTLKSVGGVSLFPSDRDRLDTATKTQQSYNQIYAYQVRAAKQAASEIAAFDKSVERDTMASFNRIYSYKVRQANAAAAEAQSFDRSVERDTMSSYNRIYAYKVRQANAAAAEAQSFDRSVERDTMASFNRIYSYKVRQANAADAEARSFQSSVERDTMSSYNRIYAYKVRQANAADAEAKSFQASVERDTMASFNRMYAYKRAEQKKAAAEELADQIAAAKAYNNNIKHEVSVATGSATGNYSSIATRQEVLVNPDKTRAAAAALKLQNAELAQFAATANTAHSSARGLASGFNLLWLTWGNMMPLLIGAGLSHGFMEVVKSGSDVNHTLTLLGAMSEESSASVAKLNANLLETARSGPFGPKQVAEAMKTLSQAGQTAEEVLRSIQPTLNFSLAGDIGIAKAADTLVSVTTAFNMGAGGFSHAGDVIAKTAAASKTSVENMAGAFKMASVLNTQYGVSLVDVGVGLAALANLGIEASAAGTALRNMYVDLSGRSAGVAKVLKAQGIQMRELSSGEFPDLIKVVEKLNAKLAEKTPIAAQGLLKAIASERGGKPIVELINLFRSLDSEGQRALVNLKSRIEESYGFAAQVAINASLTAKSQLQSLGAAFSADMVQAFDELQPNILMAVNNIKQTLAGGGFKSAVQGMAATVAGLAEAVSSNIQVFLIAGGIWGASRLILMALAAAQEALAAKTLLANAALIAAGQASEVVAVGSTAAATAVSGLAKAFMAFNVILGVAIAAYTLFEFLKARSSQTKANAADAVGEDVIAKIQAETARLNRESELLKQTGSFAQTNIALQAEERFGAVRKQYALEQVDYETKIKDLREYQAKISPGGVTYRNSGAERGDDGGKMRSEQVATARELAEWEGKLGASKVRQLEVESRLLAVSDKHLEAAKTNAKIIEETSKRKPLGLGTEGFEKPGGTRGGGKHGQLERVENFAADMLRVENDYHQRGLKLLEQSESDERRLLDAKHNALLVSEAEYQAQALDLVMRNEAARAAEANRHYTTGVNEVSGRMANLVNSPGGADVPIVSAQLAAGTVEYSKLSKTVQTLVDEYNKMLTAMQLLEQTRDAELQKVQQETSFRKQLAAVNFEGKISAEAKAYRTLGRELDVSLEKQKEKLDVEASLADMSEVQRAGAQAQLAYEEQSAQAIGKRNEALQELVATQAALAALIESKVNAGFTLESEGVVELVARYGEVKEAVAQFTKALAEMRLKAGAGAEIAKQIAEIAEARKEATAMAKDLTKSLADAVMKGSAGFKSLWTGLKDWLKSTFSRLVLQPMLQPIMQSIANQVVGSGLGSAAGSAAGSMAGSAVGSGLGSMFTTGVGGYGAMAGFGAAASYGASALMAGNGLTALSGGMSMAMAGELAQGIGMIAGVAGPLVIAAMALASLDKKATPHVGGYALSDSKGYVTDITEQQRGTKQDDTQTAMAALAKSSANLLNSMSSKFGGTGGFSVRAVFESDSNDPSWALFHLLKDNLKQTGSFDALGTLNSDPSKGLTEFSGMAADALRTALKEMNLPQWAKDQLDALGSGISISDLSTAADKINATQDAFLALTKTLAPMAGSLGQLSSASSDTLYNLATLAGGFDNLTNTLSTYYTNFYSASEQHAAGMANLTTEYNKLNMGALPATKAAFRSVIDQFVAGGGRAQEGGEKTYLTLMQLANGFASLDTAVDNSKFTQMSADLLRAQGNELGAVAIERQAELAALQATNPELVDLQTQLWGLADAAAAAAKLEQVKAGLDGIASKFMDRSELYSYKAGRIGDQLATAGINVSPDQVLGATKDQIKELWKAVGPDGKIAIEQAYQSWEDLMTLMQQTRIDDFLKGLNTTGDELMGAYDKINPKAKNLVQSWEDTTTKIDDLRSSLNSLLDLHMGETPLETALRNLKDLITKRDDLKAVVKGNEDTIYGLKSSQVSQKGVDYLKNLENNLWASYRASNGDPKIASQLTKVTLDRIKLEGQLKDAAAADAAKLNEKNIQAQKDALQAQIDGYKKLKDMAKELQTFVLDLKRGDLSNQSFAGRLNTAKGMFDTSVQGAMSGDATALGNVQGNAQEYLKQAQQFYGGSTKQYSDIFNSVTSSLNSVIGAGSGVDPMLTAAQGQLDALNALSTTTTDTSDAQIAALEELNTAFGTDVSAMSTAIDAQAKVLQDQLKALENLQTTQAAAITQAGDAYKAMIADLDEIAADMRGGRRTAELEAASV